jgi:hypothetical protein
MRTNCAVADHPADPDEVEEYEFTVLTMRVRYLVCARCRETQGSRREEIEYRLARQVEERT